MDKKIEIMEIKLLLGKKESTLTIEEAKKLKKVLDELFGKEIVKEEHHHHHDGYYPRWYWYDYSIPYYQPLYQPWCENTKYLQSNVTLTDNTLTCSIQ